MKAQSWAVLLAAASLAFGPPATAGAVGERHLVAEQPSAALRDEKGGTTLRITVWYPAAAGSVEEPLDIGPPDRPLFKPGSAAPDAVFVDERRRPTILLSHGFGGTARMMAWFGVALARRGFIVIAPDHPGNNGRDRMTVGGATLFWDRPGDLSVALQRVEAEPTLASHLDPARLGVAGFSAGGFTSLAAAGARVDLNHFQTFCAANPRDGVCRPQKEFAVAPDAARRFLARPEVAAEVKHSEDDLAIAGVRAAFVMAPAIVQSLDPKSLAAMTIPVAILLGDADQVAPPVTNGEVAAKLIPGASLKELPAVGHYDFISECTKMADAVIPMCPVKVARAATHQIATESAATFFVQALGEP